MDKFAKTVFLAISAVALISMFTMFYMENTGAYSWGWQAPRDGYCRCITGTYTAGVGGTPYGGQGMEFKGFMTFQKCTQACPGRYSWIAR